MKINNRKMKITILCSVAIIIITIIAVTSSQIPRGLSQVLDNQTQQTELPTVVVRGQISDRNRAFSARYRNLYPNRAGRSLLDLKREGANSVQIGSPSVPRAATNYEILAEKFLTDLSCQSDLIVDGIVKNKISNLSDDETFIYSEHDFEIKRVIKNNSLSSVNSNQIISVTRPGGFIKVDGEPIRFTDGSYEPLTTDREYILFLRFVPQANGYVTATPEGDFAYANGSFRSLSRLGLNNKLKSVTNSELLLNILQTVNIVGCPR